MATAVGFIFYLDNSQYDGSSFGNITGVDETRDPQFEVKFNAGRVFTTFYLYRVSPCRSEA